MPNLNCNKTDKHLHAYTYDFVGFLDLSNNNFEGSVDFGDRLHKIVTLSAINLTNNNFDGTFPCLKNNFDIQYIDIRQGKFTKISTNNCAYNKSLKYFLASFNPHLTQQFSQIAQCFSNVTTLAFCVTNVWGDVPRNVTQNGGRYLALYDTDIATRYYDIGGDKDWSQVWIVIGVTVREPLPSYVNRDERQIKMTLVPKNDFIIYAGIPMACTFAAFLIYVAYFEKYNNVLSLSKYFRIESTSGACDNETLTNKVREQEKQVSKTFHSLMRSVHKFLCSLLLILFGPLIIVYYLGADWVNNGQGFDVLRISAAYLGSHESDYKLNQLWVGTAFTLGLIYSWVCTVFSMSIIDISRKLSRIVINTKINYNYGHKECAIDNSHDINSDIDDIKTRESITSSLIVHEDCDEAPIENEKGLACKLWLFFVKSILFIAFLTFFILFLTLPIGLYNLYHSLPTENSLPLISNFENNGDYEILSFIVVHFTSFVISLQQWFLITPCVNVLIALFPFTTNESNVGIDVNDPTNGKSQKQQILISHYYKNFMVQLFRNFTFIIIPLCCLFYFDDKCLQNWKQFWPSCDPHTNGMYALGSPKNKACETIPSFSWADSDYKVIYVCFDICSTKYVFFPRCARQIFQVLGPLYTIKATIGLVFPLIYHVNTRFELKSKIKRIVCKCVKRMFDTTCTLCGSCKRKDNVSLRVNHKNKNIAVEYNHSLDIECIGLISSLEILIVFGWALPILIPIYNVIMLGYGLVYYYWLNVKSDKVYVINNGEYINIAGKWLIVSIIIQQLLMLFFYSQTQSINYAVAVIINMVGIGFYIFVKSFEEVAHKK